MIRIGLVAALAGAVLVGVALARPSPIVSRSFTAPAPFPLARNEALRSCEVLGAGEIQRPEDLAIDAEGRVYVGAPDGRIRRLSPRSGAPPVVDVYANPGGWPQGLSFDRRGRLFATSHRDPLVSVEGDGSVREYRKLKGADVMAARDGTLYIVTISFRENVADGRVALVYDALEANPNDQLVAYDPASDSIEVLLSDLYMPAGVALSADGSFVAVTEATAYRVRRYWLEGPRAGTSDLLVENLPGFPDGIASDGAGSFYVALPVLRSELVDRLHRYPWWKDQLAKLVPLLARLASKRSVSDSGYGLVVVVDESGHITRSLHDPGGQRVGSITGVGVHTGHLYVSSLFGAGIARCPLAVLRRPDARTGLELLGRHGG